jgi:enoyl-CoA hydratase/3-hydroxyacyl-CoA dehydrogenase
MTDPLDQEYDSIRIDSLAARVTRLQLDRRPKLNAITGHLLGELDDALDALERHDETQVVVVSGAGSRAFSVGADLRDTVGDMDAETATELSRRGQETFGKLARLPTPVIASIDGYCLGGGMELATCADLRIASPESTFGQPEQEHGLVPGWGGTQRLQRVVGGGRAREIILTAEQYDADTMSRYGFLNRIAEPPLEAARELAVSLAEHPAEAQRAAKRALRRGDDETAGLEFESEAFGRLAGRLDEL